MIETETLIIGASFSGLACAGCLEKQGSKYIIIEKEQQVGTPWRKHYERLHLHTHKRISNLPYKKFGDNVPRYPSREQVVEYLEAYQKYFSINPAFDTVATSVKNENGRWITKTNNQIFRSKNLVVATGPFSKPKPLSFKGLETFDGRVLHSYDFKSGSEFKGKDVLVVGFGNSACEIAIDLYEQGAAPSMSVRSPVNVIPRDIWGIPVLEISLLLSRLPPRLADAFNAPVIRLLLGDLASIGLRKKSYGPFAQIQNEGTVPVIDIGTLQHIRDGHIKIHKDIDQIDGNMVHFVDGSKKSFKAIVAAVGYNRDVSALTDVDENRLEDLNYPVNKQKYFGKDGLYCCGFWISPTGQIREIGSDARKIARHILKTAKDFV